MAGPSTYYPREDAGQVTKSQALLDYWALIGPLVRRVAQLEAELGIATGFLQVPSGDFFLTPGGDRLAMPG